MPRIRRLLTPFFPHHIMSRGNNRQDIFLSRRHKTEYCNRIMRYKQVNRIHINHYCLMDNHIHFIISLEADSTLSKFMKQLNLSYYHLFKSDTEFCGHFLQGRYKSNIIDNDPYFMHCGKYIELNPVRADMVSTPEDYSFSSYRFYAKGINDPMITPDVWYLRLGQSAEERRRRYREFVIENKVVNSEALRSQLYVGSPGFIRRMEAHLGIKNVRNSRGRPKKNNNGDTSVDVEEK